MLASALGAWGIDLTGKILGWVVSVWSVGLPLLSPSKAFSVPGDATKTFPTQEEQDVGGGIRTYTQGAFLS